MKMLRAGDAPTPDQPRLPGSNIKLLISPRVFTSQPECTTHTRWLSVIAGPCTGSTAPDWVSGLTGTSPHPQRWANPVHEPGIGQTQSPLYTRCAVVRLHREFSGNALRLRGVAPGGEAARLRAKPPALGALRTMH